MIVCLFGYDGCGKCDLNCFIRNVGESVLFTLVFLKGTPSVNQDMFLKIVR